jgi:hypothetical protein
MFFGAFSIDLIQAARASPPSLADAKTLLRGYADALKLSSTASNVPGVTKAGLARALELGEASSEASELWRSFSEALGYELEDSLDFFEFYVALAISRPTVAATRGWLGGTAVSAGDVQPSVV